MTEKLAVGLGKILELESRDPSILTAPLPQPPLSAPRVTASVLRTVGRGIHRQRLGRISAGTRVTRRSKGGTTCVLNKGEERL